MSAYFISTTILLLLVTDPVGGFPVYVSLLKNVPRERKLKVILRETGVASLVLLAFMFFGRGFLAIMHLSETSLGIAGGVVLFLIALRMIFPHPDGVMGETLEKEPFIVPLAIPLIAGPSALATVLLLVARGPDKVPEIFGALAVTMGVTVLTLFFAERISQFVGESVTKAFERLMGLILTAIAIEMLLSGIQSYVVQLKQVIS
ncbi:MAG: MarC family protein [Formivibrio sp.]|nr:MarC family protein [Formivibrio sp.]